MLTDCKTLREAAGMAIEWLSDDDQQPFGGSVATVRYKTLRGKLHQWHRPSFDRICRRRSVRSLGPLAPGYIEFLREGPRGGRC